MNDKNKKIVTILSIFTIIFTLMGGTLAYWTWTSTEITGVAFTIDKDFSCSADGGQDLTSTNVALQPTADCTNSESAIQRTIKVTPSISKNDLTISLNMWLKVNDIDPELAASDNLMYAISTEPGSCKKGMNGYINSGNFKDLAEGNKVNLVLGKSYTGTNLGQDTYYLYIWLDAAETNSNTMDKSFDFSLGGECTDDPEILTLSKDTMAYDILINNPVPVAGATTGLFKSIDDLGTSYYYSGDVTNNYVQFGTYAVNGPIVGYYLSSDSSDYREYNTLEACTSASYYNVNCGYLYEENDPMYWRIVRINGDGTLRLVYDGPEKVANGTNHNATIGSTTPGDYFHDLNFIGSGLQEELDLWYNTHLKTNYDGYVADEIFCEDSEVVHTDYWAWDDDEEGYFIEITSDDVEDYDDFVYDYYYAPYERLLSQKSLPQLTCTRDVDRHTMSTSLGNGILTSPIGLLTADEVAFAGGTYDISNNTQYLYSGESFWTISPAYDAYYSGEDMATFMSVTVSGTGYLDVSYNCVMCEDGVRPVINLRADVEFAGDGSFETPYVIKTN